MYIMKLRKDANSEWETLDVIVGPQGPQGIQGETGPAGINGVDGYTPVKGTDYYTEEDKQEIINAVNIEITYTREQIDAMLGSYITDIDTLLGGEA